MWAKQQGFRIIKDCVVRLEVVPNLEDEIIDKENVDPLTPILRNPKKRSGKGRPLGTKRFKSSTEAPKPKSRNQRNCRKCGKVGQNCKLTIIMSNSRATKAIKFYCKLESEDLEAQTCFQLLMHITMK
ncbi:hypothetical protein RhiirA4_445851 [Rhizophagus irregularis]|uniref:Uncharacterized protein n=1 Tax=Rhizophagus irregularis TaxID=588596 RepID=A0A2I1GRY2_9GLOM|nr:hypothetical protein RhiirA4_445851 [Rhizophagus irregularis]